MKVDPTCDECGAQLAEPNRIVEFSPDFVHLEVECVNGHAVLKGYEIATLAEVADDRGLNEIIGDLKEKFSSEKQTDEDRDRIVREVLDMTETYQEAPGPEGPWYYRSLTITRRMNNIHIKDVDGKPADRLLVPDLSDLTDEQIKERLKAKLDEIHQETLDQL